jgi:predicted O-methyltransferase YrrM
MNVSATPLTDELYRYLLRVGVREPAVLTRLRAENDQLPGDLRDMPIAVEQAALMALLVETIGARRCIELGTFTGYSSLAVALAMPPDGRLVCCDVSEEWTAIARRWWHEAGVAERIELRIGPAADTLRALVADGSAGSWDFAFMDADKERYPEAYELLLALLRPGGLLVVDNVFWDGDVIRPTVDDSATRGVRQLNQRLAADERVTIAMLPIADGVTIVRKR